MSDALVLGGRGEEAPAGLSFWTIRGARSRSAGCLLCWGGQTRMCFGNHDFEVGRKRHRRERTFGNKASRTRPSIFFSSGRLCSGSVASPPFRTRGSGPRGPGCRSGPGREETVDPSNSRSVENPLDSPRNRPARGPGTGSRNTLRFAWRRGSPGVCFVFAGASQHRAWY